MPTPDCPPTSSPYLLSEPFRHLVESPDEFATVIKDRMCRLQNKLAQLNRLELRQAKADIVYLMAVLNCEGVEVAQGKAEECWRTNREHASARDRRSAGSRDGDGAMEV